MNFQRRYFLKKIGVTSAAFLAGASVLKSTSFIDLLQNTPKEPEIKELKSGLKYIMPPKLSQGDTVAIISPGSPTNLWEARFGKKVMMDNGLKIIYGDTVAKQRNEYRYLSQLDDFRAKEFMDLVKNPEVKCIFAARGGFGSCRILNRLDYDIIAANPKTYIGFSDITSIITAIHNKTGIVTYHAPVASTIQNMFSIDAFNNILFSKKNNAPYKINYLGIETINKGKAQGRLVGGNLSAITALLGTPYEIDCKDKILFLEEVSEDAYKIDRMLSHLELAGKFDDASGIMLGIFNNLTNRRPFFPNVGFTILELFHQYFTRFKKPVIYGAPFGHSDDNITLPIGTFAEFNGEKKELILHNTI